MPEFNSEETPLLDDLSIDIRPDSHGELEITEYGQNEMNRQEKLHAAMHLITSPLTGAGSAYSTFGPIAMFYYQGLWLLAPVSTGAVISITDAALSILIKKHPDSPLLNKMQSAFKVANRFGIGYLADFGFSWNLIKTTAILAGGKSYANNTFAKVIAPMLSVLPALLSRLIRYKQSTGELAERNVARHIALFIRGAASASAIFSTLLIQQLLEVDSVIPVVSYILLGVMALSASLGQESFPMASFLLMSFINMFAENPSLSVLSFSLFNDVYAALNNWKIPESFFYSNAAINSCYLIILSVISARMVYSSLNSAVSPVRSSGEDAALAASSIDEFGVPPSDWSYGDDSGGEESDEYETDDSSAASSSASSADVRVIRTEGIQSVNDFRLFRQKKSNSDVELQEITESPRFHSNI